VTLGTSPEDAQQSATGVREAEIRTAGRGDKKLSSSGSGSSPPTGEAGSKEQIAAHSLVAVSALVDFPRLRQDLEAVQLEDIHGRPYVLLRSSEGFGQYVRLSPQEWSVAREMSGAHSISSLVGEYARHANTVAPEHVTRLVMRLYAAGMLDAIPGPGPGAASAGSLSFRRRFRRVFFGERRLLFHGDRFFTFLYRAGGRVLFHKWAVICCALLGLIGAGFFVWSCLFTGLRLFLLGDSYQTGTFLALFFFALVSAAREIARGLATVNVGRKVGPVFFTMAFGLPAFVVDTRSAQMAGRVGRVQRSASGPFALWMLGGFASVLGFILPDTAPVFFKLAFCAYVVMLVSLHPGVGLDGAMLAEDWFEVPRLHDRAMAVFRAVFSRTRSSSSREETPSIIAVQQRSLLLYAVVSMLWTVAVLIFGAVFLRDRISGVIAGATVARWPVLAAACALTVGLYAPFLWQGARCVRSLLRRIGWFNPVTGFDARFAALRRSRLRNFDDTVLYSMAAVARWRYPRNGDLVLREGEMGDCVFVVVNGELEGARSHDLCGTARVRATAGDLVGVASAFTSHSSSLHWRAFGARLLAIPRKVFTECAESPLKTISGLPFEQAEEILDHEVFRGATDEDRVGMAHVLDIVSLEVGDEYPLSASTAALVQAGCLQCSSGPDLGEGDLVLGPFSFGEEEDQTILARERSLLITLPLVEGARMLLRGGGNFAKEVGSVSVIPRSPAQRGVFGGAEAALFASPTPLFVENMAEPWSVSSVFGVPETPLQGASRLLGVPLFLLLGSLFFFGSGEGTWLEIPDNALFLETRGSSVLLKKGNDKPLVARARRTVPAGTMISNGPEGDVTLTARGGSSLVLCPSSVLQLDFAGRRTGEGEVRAKLSVKLRKGRLLVFPDSTGASFAPLELDLVTESGIAVHNLAPYAVDATGVRYDAGEAGC